MKKNLNEIILEKYKIPSSIGIYDFEKQSKQDLIFTVVIQFNSGETFFTDTIENTINYERVIEIIDETVSSRHFSILENMAETLAQEFLSLRGAEKTSIAIEKPGVTKNKNSGAMSIRITRER